MLLLLGKRFSLGGGGVGVEKSGRGRSLGVSPTCTSQLGPPAPPLLPASPPPPSLPWVGPQARELGPAQALLRRRPWTGRQRPPPPQVGLSPRTSEGM